MRPRRRQLLGLDRLSVVIPTLDAAASLGRCLERLCPVGEVIVADGGSTDGTIRLAEAAGARLVVSAKGRGVQLHAGAQAAVGRWLLFLHADTVLESGWRKAAAKHIASSPDAACFRFRLDDDAWQARLLERAVALRAGRLALPYGDQGLLISRALYDEVGGYKPLPLMEDVDLVRRIGKRRLRVLEVAAVTSAERWRRGGWLRRSARNMVCLALFKAGLPADRIARLYS